MLEQRRRQQQQQCPRRQRSRWEERKSRGGISASWRCSRRGGQHRRRRTSLVLVQEQTSRRLCSQATTAAAYTLLCPRTTATAVTKATISTHAASSIAPTRSPTAPSLGVGQRSRRGHRVRTRWVRRPLAYLRRQTSRTASPSTPTRCRRRFMLVTSPSCRQRVRALQSCLRGWSRERWEAQVDEP